MEYIMKNQDIPKGYMLSVRTWENDWDCHKTQIQYGLTEQDVRFYVSIAQEFRSANRRDRPGMGNAEIKEHTLYKLIEDNLAKYAVSDKVLKDIGWDTRPTPEEGPQEFDAWIHDAVHAGLCETILGTTEEYWDYYMFCRVVETIEVKYFKEPVKDVTKFFV